MAGLYNNGDKFDPVVLEPGTKVYRLDTQATDAVTDENGEPVLDENGQEVRVPRFDEDGNPVYEGEFFATEEQLKEGGYITTDEDGKEHFDAERYADDMQIAPYDDETAAKFGSYKDHISVFEVQEPVNAKDGVTDANYPYGSGGGEQIVISKDEQDKLKKLDEEYEVDNQDIVDKHAAKDMLTHGKEVADVESGEVDQEQIRKMDADAAKRRKEAEAPVSTDGINPYGLSEDELAEMEESEALSREKLSSYTDTTDQYDDKDNWE